jgi:hypothetical protein
VRHWEDASDRKPIQRASGVRYRREWDKRRSGGENRSECGWNTERVKERKSGRQWIPFMTEEKRKVKHVENMGECSERAIMWYAAIKVRKCDDKLERTVRCSSVAWRLLLWVTSSWDCVLILYCCCYVVQRSFNFWTEKLDRCYSV